MTDPGIDRCFERAVVLEEIMRDFYRKEAVEFSHEEAVHRFLNALAAEEVAHAFALERAREQARVSPPEGIETRPLLERIERLEGKLRAEVAGPCAHFEDLYQRILRLETSEVNQVFEILASGALRNPQDSGPVREQIKDHILRVTDFGKRFDRAARLRTVPRPLP